MNINKKLDRLKQWTNEKMGAEARTGLSEEFKALEVEMNLRHEGMDKMQRAMTVYIKSLSKRAEGDDREKQLPGGHLGSSMVMHGEDFEPDSEFGNCLSSLGRANERLARVQETYVANATSSWLESLERSLVQMKEYQTTRKKLEARRLAYDTSLAKMQKSKKEDFRMEEELRSQKAKYEETSEEVFRRMQDIKESEIDMVQDLSAFLEAELSYHDRCREILLNVKREWPAKESRPAPTRPTRSRSNTAHGYADRFNPVEEEPEPEVPRITIPKLSSRSRSPGPETQSPGGYALRPSLSRTSTYDNGANGPRDDSPAKRVNRVPTDPSSVISSRNNLRPVRNANTFADDNEDDYTTNQSANAPPSPDNSSVSSARGSVASRAASWSQVSDAGGAKKAPPPPPPSRAKKPPPPPPPMKRSALSASEVAQY